MAKKLKDRELQVPSWKSLRPFGASRIAASSYFLLFFVPIAAKLVSLVHDPLTVKLFGAEFELSLELPFNWKVLYAGAIASAFGRALFSYFCPALIRQYSSFSDFRHDGESGYRVKKEYLDCCSEDPEIRGRQRREYASHLCVTEYKRDGRTMTKSPGDDESFLHEFPIKGGNSLELSDSYHYTVDFCSDTRPVARAFCGLCFLVSGVLGLWIVLESALWVFAGMSTWEVIHWLRGSTPSDLAP